MENKATKKDIAFLGTLCLIIGKRLGFIEMQQMQPWHLEFDEWGKLDEKNLLGATGSTGSTHFVLLSPGLNEKNLLSTIAHESVHLIQFMTGAAQIGDGLTQIVWKGQSYDILPEDSPDYESQPWEEEAFRHAPQILKAIQSVPELYILDTWKRFQASEWSYNLVINFQNAA